MKHKISSCLKYSIIGVELLILVLEPIKLTLKPDTISGQVNPLKAKRSPVAPTHADVSPMCCWGGRGAALCLRGCLGDGLYQWVSSLI